MPGEGRPQLVIIAFKLAETARMRDGGIGAEIEPIDGRRAGRISAARHRTERAGLKRAAVMQLRRRREMDEVDRAARRSAAEQRGAGAFEYLDAFDAVQRMRK